MLAANRKKHSLFPKNFNVLNNSREFTFFPKKGVTEGSEGFTFFSGKMQSRSGSEGFTLIEILIVVAIIAVVTLVALASLSTLQRQVDITSSSQNIISVLHLARSKTLASEGANSYGVHFETSQYVLFTGTSYSSSDTNNKVYSLSGVQISQINLAGGGSEVVFDRIQGTTSENGNIVLVSTTNASQTAQIDINSSGQTSLDTIITTANTRIVDSRHLHFDFSGGTNDCDSNLGWSIKTSTTLTLVWTDSPNPTVTQNIPMAGFFNADKSVFDWSGTVGVNGANQTLRIHTHCLSAFNTLLSIDRDLRYNNKALTVSIDGKQIVSYTDAGVATVGAYGGSMTVQ